MNLASNLKRLRINKGWSQNHLAKKANVPQSAIHYIEKGKRDPGLKTTQKLADALGVSVSELLDEGESQAG